MPDRQRHSSLSDEFARLSAARSENSPAPPGRHRGTAPARPEQEAAPAADDEGSASSGHQISTTAQSNPPRPESSRADTVELSRSVWRLSGGQDQAPDEPEQPTNQPDPMADTTMLRRVTLPQPTEESAGLDSGPDAATTAPDAAANSSTAADTCAAANAGAMDDTTLLSRVTLAQPSPVSMVADSGSDAVSADSGATAPDPTADTTLLRRVTLPQPTEEPAGPDTTAAAPIKPTWSQTLRTLLDRHRRRFAIGGAGLVVIGVLLALPPVQAQLRDSFTRLPQPYTALYFTSPPQVDGTVLTVPVSVHAVETGTDAYSVRVWTVDAKGKVDDSQTADLKWDGQALSAVVSMPVNPQADYVWVSLNGSSQVLHYKIAVA